MGINVRHRARRTQVQENIGMVADTKLFERRTRVVRVHNVSIVSVKRTMDKEHWIRDIGEFVRNKDKEPIERKWGHSVSQGRDTYLAILDPIC